MPQIALKGRPHCSRSIHFSALENRMHRRNRQALAQETKIRELLDRHASLTPRERDVNGVGGLLNKQ